MSAPGTEAKVALIRRLLKRFDPSTIWKGQLTVPQAVLLGSVCISLGVLGGTVAVTSTFKEVGLTGFDRISAAMKWSSTPSGQPTVTSAKVCEASASVERTDNERVSTAASSRGESVSIVPALAAIAWMTWIFMM